MLLRLASAVQPARDARHATVVAVELHRADAWCARPRSGRATARTMDRILEANAEVRERRNQLRHPHYAVAEPLATRPNELWSWDITKLLGSAKWTYFHRYVILDVFSRHVVGWMVATRASNALAKKLIAETCARQGMAPAQLTLHADRGSSMKSKPVALLLADLGVTKTHSRPHVSNDDPFSEAQFKTLKYRPEFPERFGSVHDARPLRPVHRLAHRRSSPRRHRAAHTSRRPLWPRGGQERSVRPRLRRLTERTWNVSLMGFPRRRSCPAGSGSTSRRCR